MMQLLRRQSRGLLAALVASALLVASCSSSESPAPTSPAAPTGSSSSQPSSTPQEASVPPKTNAPLDSRPQPAPAAPRTATLLPDPAVGLAGLKSYRGVLDQTLKGTMDGKPFERRTHIEHSVITQSGDQEVITEVQATGSKPSYTRTLRVSDGFYLQSGKDAPFQARPFNEQEDVPAQLTAFLLPILEASRAGSETVSGTAATHFRFSQSGLPLADKGMAVSGDVWIAENGGPVLKYTIEIQPPAKATGKGLEASKSWSYALDKINAIDRIELPRGCPPVMTDIPAMPNANNIVRRGGYMAYSTPSQTTAVLDFYGQRLPPLGWKPERPGRPTEGVQEYTQGNKSLTLLMEKQENGLAVSAFLYDPSIMPAPPTATPRSTPLPPAAIATVEPGRSGLPPDVPLPPGATGVANLSAAAPSETSMISVQFNATGSAQEMLSFYKEKMSAGGWTLLTETEAGGTQVQAWQKQSRITAISIVSEGGALAVTVAAMP